MNFYINTSYVDIYSMADELCPTVLLDDYDGIVSGFYHDIYPWVKITIGTSPYYVKSTDVSVVYTNPIQPSVLYWILDKQSVKFTDIVVKHMARVSQNIIVSPNILLQFGVDYKEVEVDNYNFSDLLLRHDYLMTEHDGHMIVITDVVLHDTNAYLLTHDKRLILFSEINTKNTFYTVIDTKNLLEEYKNEKEKE